MKRMALLLLVVLSMAVHAMGMAQIDFYRYTGYVYIEANGYYQWYPLAETEEASYSVPVKQLAEDGHEMINIIRITDKAVFMESSTCENQDCVGQGEVTLENKELRILSNYIICLPHQVVVQLYSAEEFHQWYIANYGEGE